MTDAVPKHGAKKKTKNKKQIISNAYIDER